MKARDNPFSTDRLERVRFRLPDVSWEEVLARLRGLNHHAAVLGPHGSGKTTFLDHLEPRLAADGFLVRRAKLDEERCRLTRADTSALCAGLGRRDIVFLDGAEQLDTLGWWRFARAMRPAGGLVITSHVAGRLPRLIEFRPRPDLLAELIAELSGQAACAEVCPVAGLFAKHAGNLRHALLECYDDHARK